MIKNETTDKTFEVKDGKYVYKITGLKFSPEQERLFGKIKLEGGKKQSSFYINFIHMNFASPLLDKIYVDYYKGNDDEDIYRVVNKFRLEHVEEETTCENKNGNFELVKKIIFK